MEVLSAKFRTFVQGDVMDKNRDGFISKMEMIESSPHLTISQVDAVFRRNDADADRKLFKAFQLLEYQWREGRFDQLPAHASPFLFMTEALVQGGVQKHDPQKFKRLENIEFPFNRVGEISARISSARSSQKSYWLSPEYWREF